MRTKELDEIWANCVSMWRYIAKQCKDNKDIKGLRLSEYKQCWLKKHNKQCWLKKHKTTINVDCFFCFYATKTSTSCDACPGRLVDSTFSCCNSEYHFSNKPIKFYNKIKYLYYNYYLKGKVVNYE